MQSGEIRLAVYGMKYFQVFDLPPVSQEQCSIRISGELFQIPEDITLHLEALDGEWCFPESREYSIHWKNEVFFLHKVHENEILMLTSKKGSRLLMIAQRKGDTIPVYRKFSLDKNQTVTGANWAQDARAWAMANGVSDGTAADRAVTREELVTMIWRYVGQPQGTGDLSGFADADTVSDWAEEAMSWSVGAGLIQGDENGLTPTATAIRAQIAAILMRFCENVAK